MNIKEKIFNAMIDQHINKGTNESKELLRHLTDKKFPSHEAADRLYSSVNDWGIYHSFADNKHTPTHILKKLIGKGEVLAEKVARNPGADKSIFKDLMTHMDKHDEMAEHGDYPHTYHVARSMLINKNLPEEFHEPLIKKLDDRFLQSVASYGENGSVLKKLVNHPSYKIRGSLAENKHVPIHMKEKLANDVSFDVRQTALHDPRHSPEFLHGMTDHPDKYVKIAVLSHPKIKEETLVKLSKDPDHSIRQHVAQHEKTPSEILERMTNDEHPYVARDAKHMIQLKKFRLDSKP